MGGTKRFVQLAFDVLKDWNAWYSVGMQPALYCDGELAALWWWYPLTGRLLPENSILFTICAKHRTYSQICSRKLAYIWTATHPKWQKKQVRMRWRPKLLSHLSNILATQCVNALQNGICKLFTAPAIAGKRGSRGVIYICNCPALSGPEQLSSATRMCCRLGSTQYLWPMFETIDRELVTCSVSRVSNMQ